MMDGLSPLLACPRCDRAPLVCDGEDYSCKACKVTYPSLNGIPWLFAEPDAALGEWRERLNLVVRRLEHDAVSISTELEQADLHKLTKARLEHLRDANLGHAAQLNKLLEPLSLQKMQGKYETYLALRTRLPSRQGLTTYYVNVHRDWAWGEEENEASFKLVTDAMGVDREPGKVLILGAGACRLAYDMHHRCSPELTIALDINPMLLLLAQQVMRGEKLDLYEFPIAPKSANEVAVLRTLSVDKAVSDNFSFVLADALRPPFVPGSFDTVITPWLVDIVSEDLETLARRINALLAPGGRWVNFGSLSFVHQQQAKCYNLDEALAVVDDAGFAAAIVSEARIPYMSSPASRHSRYETAVTWAADKNRDSDKPPRHNALPDWIVKGEQPVPLLQSFQMETMQTRIFAFIMSMIDGKRTLNDMAKILVDKHLMTTEEAGPAIRGFLIKMYENSRERPQF